MLFIEMIFKLPKRQAWHLENKIKKICKFNSLQISVNLQETIKKIDISSVKTPKISLMKDLINKSIIEDYKFKIELDYKTPIVNFISHNFTINILNMN